MHSILHTLADARLVHSGTITVRQKHASECDFRLYAHRYSTSLSVYNPTANDSGKEVPEGTALDGGYICAGRYQVHRVRGHSRTVL